VLETIIRETLLFETPVRKAMAVKTAKSCRSRRRRRKRKKKGEKAITIPIS
jgi:hypothetical protein